MQLLAHRGLWNRPEEKNSLQALVASFNLGIGVETDIRDCDGSLVISHDPPRSAELLPLNVFLQAYIASATRPTLALNIKADGLHSGLLAALQQFGVDNYFVFDMSIPDTLGYERLSMPFAARISEYEPTNIFTQTANWIWLDSFHGEWFKPQLIEYWLNQGKQIAIVSPELHRRAHLPLWQMLKTIHHNGQLYLCTDLVTEAKEFFNVE